jgi:hypothetical protein
MLFAATQFGCRHSYAVGYSSLPSSPMAGQSLSWNGLIGAYLVVDDDEEEKIK